MKEVSSTDYILKKPKRINSKTLRIIGSCKIKRKNINNHLTPAIANLKNLSQKQQRHKYLRTLTRNEEMKKTKLLWEIKGLNNLSCPLIETHSPDGSPRQRDKMQHDLRCFSSKDSSLELSRIRWQIEHAHPITSFF